MTYTTHGEKDEGEKRKVTLGALVVLEGTVLHGASQQGLICALVELLKRVDLSDTLHLGYRVLHAKHGYPQGEV